MKKKVLSGLLAIALVFGSAAALPEGVFETSSTIRASADSYISGDFSYELSKNGKFVMITKYLDKTSKTRTIPNTIDGKPVEIIAHAAFRDHTELEGVVFPKSLRGIANVAFKGCTSLRKLDLPDSLTQISESAFDGCTNLESVTIPKGVKTIGKNAFANCECLGSVTIQDGVGGIGVGAFSGCTWLSNITIPGSVKTIAVNAFNKCINLERVTISDGVEFIGAYAFTGCPGLSRLVIPQSVKTIGKDNTAYPYSEDNPICDKDKCSIACYPGSNALTYAAFNGYKIEYISGDYVYKELKDETVEITGYLGKDKTLTIPSELAEKKVSGIGNGAFANMSDLTSVTIQKGITSIGDSAFAMCKSLKSITIPSSVTSIGNSAFRYCWSLTSVTIPNGVTNIGNYAFADCDSLTSVTIPSSVKSIGYYAFSGCESLTSVTIPSSIKIINSSMFDDCSSLTSVTIPDSVTTIKGGAFAGCSSLKSITIPKSVTSIDHCALGYDYDDDHMLMVNPDFIVRCYKDSAAEKYAKDNNLKIEYITAKHVAAKKATCTTDGNIEYWKYGNKYYSDKELTKQIDESKIVIKATGHKWGTPSWTWNGTASAGAKFVCSNDKSHVKTVEATITSKTTKATCEKDGKTVYTATVTFNGQTYTKTKTVTIDKLGHNYGKPTWTWDGVKSATAKFTCANDKSHVKNIKATIKSTTTKPTCTKAGKTVYTATVKFGDKTYTNSKTVTLKALGHKMGDWKTTSFNVDKKTATQKRTCSKGDKTETKTVTNAVVRFAGSNRAETGTLISAGMYKTADTVIIATGFDFHDALAAVPLASAYNAPLLLADRDNLSQKTINEIKRLKAKNVIVVATTSAKDQNGYDAAIKSNVYNQLKELKVKITKLDGKTYYETAKKVAVQLKTKSKKAPTSVFITTDKNYADALSASPVAAVLGAPILYVDPKASLNATTKNYLTSIKKSVKNVYIVGGVNAVSKNVEKSVLSVLGKTSATRFAGDNRYETCVLINKSFAKNLTGKSVCIAKGYNFPDALAGGVFAAKNKAPLFLADAIGDKTELSKTQSDYLKSKNPNKLYIFGGETAVPTALVKTVAKASI